MGLTNFEEAIAAITAAEEAVVDLVGKIRRVDRLLPTGAVTFNGAIDDLMLGTQRIMAAAERLRARSATQRGQGELDVPPPAGVIGADGAIGNV